MSYTPPNRAGRMSMSGMFGSPTLPAGSAQSRANPFTTGMFGAGPTSVMPTSAPAPGGMPPGMPPPNPGMPPPNPQSSAAPPTVFPGADQFYGHPILIPSITALAMGIATSRPPDPNMMWDTSKGQWTSDLTNYTNPPRK